MVYYKSPEGRKVVYTMKYNKCDLTERMNVRMTTEDKERLYRLANEFGLSASEAARAVLCSATSAILDAKELAPEAWAALDKAMHDQSGRGYVSEEDSLA